MSWESDMFSRGQYAYVPLHNESSLVYSPEALQVESPEGRLAADRGVI